MKRTLHATALAIAIDPGLAAERPFVDAADIVPGLVADIRYAGANNFVGRPIAGYEKPRCLLTRDAAEALRHAQASLAGDGLGLKVFDCYRPKRAVADFVAWAKDASDTRMKLVFYPEVDKRDLFRLGYVAESSSHSRGSTVDITLVRRTDGSEIDMGTPFDFFGPASAAGSAQVTAQQSTHRHRLRDVMIRAGFRPYDQEWWHFTLVAEPFPTTAFDRPVR